MSVGESLCDCADAQPIIFKTNSGLQAFGIIFNRGGFLVLDHITIVRMVVDLSLQ